jgi:hypothetical protein
MISRHGLINGSGEDWFFDGLEGRGTGFSGGFGSKKFLEYSLTRVFDCLKITSNRRSHFSRSNYET